MSDKLVITKLREESPCYIVALFQEQKLCRTALYEPEKDAPRVGDIYGVKVREIAKNIHMAFCLMGNEQLCCYDMDEKVPPLILKKTGKKLPVSAGDEMLVQVKRVAAGKKYPQVTGQLSIAGSFAVAQAGIPGVRYSTHLTEQEKTRLSFLEKEELPCGLLVRTNSRDASREQILEEAVSLCEKLRHVISTAPYRTVPGPILKRQGIEAVLDGFYRRDYETIVTDRREIVALLDNSEGGDYRDKLTFYEDPLLSLAAFTGLKQKMTDALSPKVWLKSGGYILIQPTEALTAIDVNSGKNEKGTDKEEMIRKLNLEAAEEICRQLILRRIGGIVIIDFINMRGRENREQLMDRLRELLEKDPMHPVLVDMTPLGLVEITRARKERTLQEEMALLTGEAATYEKKTV